MEKRLGRSLWEGNEISQRLTWLQEQWEGLQRRAPILQWHVSHNVLPTPLPTDDDWFEQLVSKNNVLPLPLPNHPVPGLRLPDPVRVDAYGWTRAADATDPPPRRLKRPLTRPLARPGPVEPRPRLAMTSSSRPLRSPQLRVASRQQQPAEVKCIELRQVQAWM